MSSSSYILAHLHFALISQKRERLCEKHAKGTQAGIAHRVQLWLPLAHVRKLLRTLPQSRHKPLEHGPLPASDPGSRLWRTRSHTHQLRNQFKLRTAAEYRNLLTLLSGFATIPATGCATDSATCCSKPSFGSQAKSRRWVDLYPLERGSNLLP